MAKTAYNSFVVVDCKSRRNVLCTQSARKATDALEKGRRIEVWNSGSIVERIYSGQRHEMTPYIDAEREYIGQKQKRHEERNERRRAYGSKPEIPGKPEKSG